MEEIREFLEDKSNLKCCIPQRDFSFTATDDVTEIEQGIEQSSTTLVLWSREALETDLHRAEYKLARSIEFRRFNVQLVHVALQDLSDVTDQEFENIKTIKFYKDWTDAKKQKVLEKILGKIYRKISKKND